MSKYSPPAFWFVFDVKFTQALTCLQNTFFIASHYKSNNLICLKILIWQKTATGYLQKMRSSSSDSMPRVISTGADEVHSRLNQSANKLKYDRMMCPPSQQVRQISPKLEKVFEKDSNRNSNSNKTLKTLIWTLTILMKTVHFLDLYRKSLDLFQTLTKIIYE